MSIVATSSILIVNTTISQKTSSAAEIHAQDVANNVANAIINVCLLKENYPSVDYSTTVDIPLQLIDYFNYYIEVDNNFVYVNSTDGLINVKSSLFNCSYRIGWDIRGSVMGADQLVISCNSSNYIYKFDFGTEDSSGVKGYTRISDECYHNDWLCVDCNYRIPIFVSNPLGYEIENYTVLIQLNDKNFNHLLVNETLKDIRFFNPCDSDEELYFWVENWYSSTTKTSRIWVNVTKIPVGGCTIYMYFGNPTASGNSFHDGSKTFLFFDNFTNSVMSNWDLYYDNKDSRINIVDGNLVLKNGAAVTAKKYINPFSTPYIIETKARSIATTDSSYYLEASVFARKINNSLYPPYYYASVFSSGRSISYPQTIIYYESGWKNYTSYYKTEINEDWYRLKYILNGTDDIIARYFYETFALDDVPSAITYNTKKDGKFGLCITNVENVDYDIYDITAYYDWIFVRKFVSNPLAGDTRKDVEPIAYVGCVQSTKFYWKSGDVDSKSTSSAGGRVGDDLVFDGGTTEFKVEGLDNSKFYSFLFTIGDSSSPSDVLEMKIDISHSIGNEIIDFPDCFPSMPHIKRWVSNLKPSSGSFTFTFYSISTVVSAVWALNELTIMQGERIIWIKEKI